MGNNVMNFFQSGKLSVVMDGAFGSSGKGKMTSYLAEKYVGKWSFACHAFMSNAAHTVVSSRGTFMYQCLSSVAYLTDAYDKIYICGGAVIELEPLLREIEENGIPKEKLGIHPLVAVVTQRDIDYERGICDFDGNPKPDCSSVNLSIGSTLHGVGAARARRILRRPDSLLARDVPELQEYLCDTRAEIVGRLDRGEAGIMEIAQGFTLGYLESFYPKTTSRNCTVAAALDDCGVPPYYLGNVLINFRTFPIRVNSSKWLEVGTNRVLKFNEAMGMISSRPGSVRHVEGDSGGHYSDQREITWSDVTAHSGSQHPIMENSTLTGNPRRVFTFSRQNVLDAIAYNRPPVGSDVFLSINFMNYVDADWKGGPVSDRVSRWLIDNIPDKCINKVALLGYGPGTHDTTEIL